MMQDRMFQLAAGALVVLLAGCAQNIAPGEDPDAALGKSPAQVTPAAEMLAGADIATLDPHTLQADEIERVIGSGAHCAFRYTSSGGPVLAYRQAAGADEAAGVVMLNGELIALETDPAAENVMVALGADRLHFALAPDGDAAGSVPTEATLVFEVGEDMRVGYRGYHTCPEAG